MGGKVTGSFDQLRLMILQGGERASNAAKRQMGKEAKMICAEAKQNAPVLESHDGKWDGTPLEDSIRVETDYGGSNGRKRFSVVVGGEAGGVDVDRYAMIMHEAVYNLGPDSEAKQAANPGVLVGRKYLERAYDERAPHIVNDLIQVVQGALAGSGSGSSSDDSDGGDE